MLTLLCHLALEGPVAVLPRHGRDTVKVAIVYTGRSLGALGVRRSQEEHELLTEQANAEQVPFKLVSHPSWRAPGIAIFLPSEEPQGDELPFVLASRAGAERLDSVPAMISASGLLLQDPWRPDPDLLAMLGRNVRTRRDFPDLAPTWVRASRLRSPRGDRIIIVEQAGAVWPEDPAAWTQGEMNRIDIRDNRLFELPLNLGELGPRATLLRSTRSGPAGGVALTVTADLGHQDGDLGLPREDRARLDFTALQRLGYQFLVPFDFELALGARMLAGLGGDFPGITLLASNVRAADSTLFTASRIIEAGPVRLGVLGLVNATARDRLPRARLEDFTFTSPVAAARREVQRLRAAGATAVVALSNLDAADNAIVAEQVMGIDAIVADLPVRWSPEATRVRVELPDRPFVRPGAPALVARSAANGLGVGRLDLEFRGGPADSTPHLAALEHRLAPITDRIRPDTALVREITSLATVVRRPRGELMFPAFVDLVNRRPDLGMLDAVTKQGRMSKGLWETFMARLLRSKGRAEVAIIRRLDQFPPLIGKLHENEIGAWLWTEDEVVVLDVLGADLLAILAEDTRGDLVVNGMDPVRRTVAGHRLDDQTYYRVATTDVLFEGARFRDFQWGRRVRRRFTISPTGDLVPSNPGSRVALKDFVFNELRRIRASARREEHLDRIAALVAPDPPWVNLLSFTFDRPTLWASLSQVYGGEGYGSVPESRVTAQNAWVVGLGGRFVVSQEHRRRALDLGLTFAYARQGVEKDGGTRLGESADDIKLDLTMRPSSGARTGRRLRSFVRGLFDTEFTPTVDPATGVANPRQLAVRASGGLMLLPGRRWRRAELAVAFENDFGRPSLQYGFQARTEFMRPFGKLGRNEVGRASYRFRNDLTYFLPSSRDNASNLALRDNMVHELVLPLVDELSLSVAADFFLFQGKVAATRTPGMSMLLRVGLTYDRLWKPRYQPFF